MFPPLQICHYDEWGKMASRTFGLIRNFCTKYRIRGLPFLCQIWCIVRHFGKQGEISGAACLGWKLFLCWYKPGLYMIGYWTGKIILKLLPFWISNEELQEWEIQMKTKTNTSQLLRGVTLLWIFPLLIFLIQLAERREFQNDFSCSVPYHI